MSCHVLYHPDCPTCVAPRTAENAQLAERHIENSPVPLSDRAKDDVRRAFMRTA